MTHRQQASQQEGRQASQPGHSHCIINMPIFSITHSIKHPPNRISHMTASHGAKAIVSYHIKSRNKHANSSVNEPTSKSIIHRQIPWHKNDTPFAINLHRKTRAKDFFFLFFLSSNSQKNNASPSRYFQSNCQVTSRRCHATSRLQLEWQQQHTSA